MIIGLGSENKKPGVQRDAGPSTVGAVAGGGPDTHQRYAFHATDAIARSDYSESADDAYQKAREHRRDIMRAAAPDRLGPTAVYEIELAELTAHALVVVLNHPDTLAQAFFLSQQLLGYLTEE